MAVRVLLMLAALTVLYSCGQVSSPAEKQEKQGGVEENGDLLFPASPTPASPTAASPTDECLGEYRSVGSFESVNYSPDGQKIVFGSIYTYDGPESSGSASATAAPTASPDEVDHEICVVNADGTGMVKLTDNSKHDYSPVWSPEGTKIAFVRSFTPSHPRYEDEEADIFVMNADGTDMVRLTDNSNFPKHDYSPVWSPEGTKIAFVREGHDEMTGALVGEIFVMNADGSNETKLSENQRDSAYVSGLSWSPAEQKIAFGTAPGSDSEDALANGRRIHIVRADGSGTPRTLASVPYSHSLGIPAWSPDGKRIALERDGEIYVIKALGEDDTDPWRRLTYSPANDACCPAWSPDGTEIAFIRAADGPGGIYKVDADGSNETRLASKSSQLSPPDWAPDGKHIAYLDNGNIVVVNADGSNPTTVVADTVE